MTTTATVTKTTICSVFIATSLDGYIARKDGGIDWLDSVQLEGEDYGFKAFFDTVDALVMGRNTYETALGFDAWPYVGKRCIVLTHRPATSLHGEEFFAGTATELRGKLAGEGVARAYIDGGVVIRQFLEARLVSELTLSVVPLLLGDGIPLFGPGGAEQGWTLDLVRSWPTGLVQSRYLQKS